MVLTVRHNDLYVKVLRLAQRPCTAKNRIDIERSTSTISSYLAALLIFHLKQNFWHKPTLFAKVAVEGRKIITKL